MQKVTNQKKKNKENCNTCPNKGICLAEHDVDPYCCTRSVDTTKIKASTDFKSSIPYRYF